MFLTPVNTKYKKIRNTFYNLFNMETFRKEILLEYKKDYSNTEEKEILTIDNLLMRIMFSHQNKILKPMKSKIFCQYIISKIEKNNLGMDQKIQEELDRLLLDEIKEEKKEKIANYIIDNIEKLIKNGISIEILLKEINLIYF